ncbi:hypothetical protein DFJ73DRAFT_372366 [Zopfochytrium polystomum]|nr:hypothetical protein DFJ73DRAFT_372366 [Zopfochytrium polystomum]
MTPVTLFSTLACSESSGNPFQFIPFTQSPPTYLRHVRHHCRGGNRQFSQLFAVCCSMNPVESQPKRPSLQSLQRRRHCIKRMPVSCNLHTRIWRHPPQPRSTPSSDPNLERAPKQAHARVAAHSTDARSQSLLQYRQTLASVPSAAVPPRTGGYPIPREGHHVNPFQLGRDRQSETRAGFSAAQPVEYGFDRPSHSRAVLVGSSMPPAGATGGYYATGSSWEDPAGDRLLEPHMPITSSIHQLKVSRLQQEKQIELLNHHRPFTDSDADWRALERPAPLRVESGPFHTSLPPQHGAVSNPHRFRAVESRFHSQ